MSKELTEALKKNRIDLAIFLLLSLVCALLLQSSGKLLAVVAVAQEKVTAERAEEILPPIAGDTNLFFVSVDPPALYAAVTSTTADGSLDKVQTMQRLTQLGLDKPATLDVKEQQPLKEDDETEKAGHDGGVQVVGLFPSPDKRRLAVQLDLGTRPALWLLDMRNLEAPKLVSMTAEGYLFFLGWHPEGRYALARAQDIAVADPGLWIVDTEDGSHRRVDIPDLVAPEGLLAAAFSADGSQIAYATSRGIGFGSQIWRTDSEGREHTLVYKDELTIAGSLTWSPDGSQIVFDKLLDSPVAFAEAGLWTVNADGSDAKYLATMDGGHGQKPFFGSDNQTLFYVARENNEDQDADYVADRLVSSIQAIDSKGGESRTLVPADGARQIDIQIDKQGNLLFASDRQGQMELWSYSKNGQLQQLTDDGSAKRYPVFLSVRENQ